MFILMNFNRSTICLFAACLILSFSCSQKKSESSLNAGNQLSLSADSLKEEYFNEDFSLLLRKYEDPTREYWQNPDLVIDKLGDFKGKTVADIGVGTGYFTFKIAPGAGKVIAVDVENKFLEYIEDRKFELGNSEIAQKIETRLCKPDDPLLSPGEADIALMVNTYHFISGRVGYLKKIYNGLKEGGVLLLVDFKAGEMPVGPPESLKILRNTALKEIIQAGFKITEVDTTSLQFQYLVKALKK